MAFMTIWIALVSSLVLVSCQEQQVPLQVEIAKFLGTEEMPSVLKQLLATAAEKPTTPQPNVLHFPSVADNKMIKKMLDTLGLKEEDLRKEAVHTPDTFDKLVAAFGSIRPTTPETMLPEGIVAGKFFGVKPTTPDSRDK